MPHKVLFVDPRLSHITGGAERLTVEKILALDPNRFAVTVLTRAGRRESALFGALRRARPDVDLIQITDYSRIDSRIDDDRVQDFVAAHRGQALVNRDETVDDAICFNTHAKAIVERADWDLVSFSFLTDLFGLEPRCPVAFHIYGLPPADMVAAEAPLLRRVSAISAVSGYVRDEFCALFGGACPPRRVTLLRPALPIRFLSPVTRGKRDIDFAYVGRLVQRKGVDTAIRALAGFGRASDVRPTLAIAGAGPEQQSLLRLCRDLDVEQQVRFCGALDAAGLIALLDRVRWFLHPGRKPEAFGLAGLEAMARGVPCLVSTPGGMREYLRDGHNGWEIPTSDTDLFAARMQAVLREADQDLALRSQARATAERFSRQHFESAVNRFYAAALEI